MSSQLNGSNSKVSAKTRIIRLYRDGSTQLGFSIRGGWEHGTGIFVSEVHPGSEAAKQGLQVGDQIVRINGYSLSHAIHADVISLVRSSAKITLKVKSCGMIPIKDRLRQGLTWKLVRPHSTPDQSLSSSPSPHWTSSDSHSDSDHEFIETNVFIDLKGRSLGCSVVKGPPTCPGIYVQNVKFNEPADQSGLEVGDQISHVNGTDVQLMDFTDAISKLKSLPSMTLTVRKGAGRHLFGRLSTPQHSDSPSPVPLPDIAHYNHVNNKSYRSTENSDKSSINSCRVTAIVHHSVTNHGIGHSRGLSIGSDGSHHSTDESDISSENRLNINDNNNSIIESPIDILQKVKLEEERLRDERKRLEEEQQKLRLEMQKLELEKKELERRKLSDECQSVSNYSLSSASNSSSGSQSIGFLDEIKAMADRKHMLRPVNRLNDKPVVTATKSVPKCDNTNDKHKQHELLMEEFRRAHRRMFGVNGIETNKSDMNSINETKEPTHPTDTKETIKASKSLPIQSITNAKIPPPVPKKTATGPVVQIGTYCDNTINNNRFSRPNHKSVIQVFRSEDNKESNGTEGDGTNGQITIKVISNSNK